MISLDKKYKTYNGDEVRLFSLNSLSDELPVIGEYYNESHKKWILCHWDINGICPSANTRNLVEKDVWDEWEIDQKVKVLVSSLNLAYYENRVTSIHLGGPSGSPDKIFNFHYAGSHKGVPYVFVDGLSSWTIYRTGQWDSTSLAKCYTNPYIVLPIPYRTNDVSFSFVI